MPLQHDKPPESQGRAQPSAKEPELATALELLSTQGAAPPVGPPDHPTAYGLRRAQIGRLQRTLGNRAVQRDVQRDGAGLSPVPNYQLTPPAPFQRPGRPSLFGGEGPQLHLDPQIEAELRALQIRTALSPAVIRPQLAQLPIGPIRLPPPAPANPLATPPSSPQPQAPPPQAQPRVGEPGEPAREGSGGDILKAVSERPEVEAAIGRIGDQAFLQWQQLRLGGQVALVSTSALIVGSTIAGIAATPDARRFVFAQLSGAALPVPGLSWLHAEFNVADDNLMLGLHLDVGRFLPTVLGFGPGSPEAMGGPPQFEDAPGAPTLRRSLDEGGAGHGGALQRQPAARQALVQRTPPDTATERPTREFFNYSGVEQARGNSMSLFLRTQMLAQGGQAGVTSARDKLMTANSAYERAFQRYERVMGQAGQEARSNERYYNLAVGVATGVVASVVVAAAAAFLFPVAAAAAVGSGAWLAVQGGSAVASAALGTAAGDLVGQTGLTSEVGHDLQPPAGLRPEAMALPVWRALSELQSTLLRFSGTTTNMFLMHGAAEYALGEIRAHVDGGTPETSEDELLDICTSLFASNQALRQYETALEAGIQQIAAINRAVAEAPAEADVNEVERDIWIMWMASLPDSQSDVLDLDAIENYLAQIGLLGPGGTLGVDFGIYTSEDDEREALAAARSHNTALSSRYNHVPRT